MRLIPVDFSREEVGALVLKKLVAAVLVACGMTLGYFVARLIPPPVYVALAGSTGAQGVFQGLTTILIMGFGGLVGLLLEPAALSAVSRAATSIEAGLKRTSLAELVAGSLGVIVGLIIANLLAISVRGIPYVGTYLAILINLVLGYLGIYVAVKKREELFNVLAAFPRSVERVVGGREKHSKGAQKPSYKILDTSVIIDGRIADIARCGFIEGTLVVPGFVLEELQHIADSSDVLKRNRGRRGLDILNRMRKEQNVTVQILEKDFEDTSEVDFKLVKLAKLLDAKILTNDFNLNKVAELHGVTVLNINELANALKPVVLPGEEMVVHVIKDGKESGQGVAYLDDGTMIVVDGGRKYIGEQIGVLVTSVLQTAAGRMIFAKPKTMDRTM